MKKAKAVVFGVFGGLLILLIGFYVSLSVYYKDGFSYNTWINGVYCTGKDIPTINDELKEIYETTLLEIAYGDTTEFIDPQSIDFSIDFSSYLSTLLDQQNPWLWFMNFSNWKHTVYIKPDYSFDHDKLKECMYSFSFVTQNIESDPFACEIRKGDAGFYLYDDHRKLLDADFLLDAIENALYSDEKVVVDESFFYDTAYTAAELENQKTWDSLSKFLATRATLDMGAEIYTFGNALLSDFIEYDADTHTFLLDNDHQFVISEERLNAYLDELCDCYDTYNKPREYNTITGKTVTIENIYYGTLIDRNDLKKRVVEAVLQNTGETIVPKYLREGYVRGLNDIGETYIEVDMENQILYYFENGDIALKTDIVSGKQIGRAHV